jgi:hypothetical protein
MIAKSTAIKGRGGRSGGRVAKAVGLTWSAPCPPGLGSSQGDLIVAQKSAEGIVGGGAPPKARTVEEGSRAAISREPCGRRISWS